MRRLLLLLIFVAAAPAGETRVLVRSKGKPLEGVGVRTLLMEEEFVFDLDTWTPEARTDAEGRVLLEGRRVMLYAPGFALAEGKLSDVDEPVDLRPERVFGGRVVDSAGGPVPHAEVALATTFNKRARFLARADAQGRFIVRALWYDAYTLTVRASGYLPLQRACHPEETGLGFTVLRPCALGGVVLQEGDEPLEGVELNLEPGGASARTDGEGRFLFESLAPGPLAVTLPAHFSASASNHELQEGERRGDLILRVVRPAWVRLAVRDAEGAPLAAAEVARQSVDAEGRATLAIPARALQEIPVTCAGYQPAAVRVGPLEPGIGEAEIAVALVRRPEIEVWVLTPEGLAAEEGTLGNRDIHDGMVLIHAGGPFELRVSGYPAASVDIAPPGPVVVTLARPSYLSGRVLDSARAPVSGGWVSVPGLFEPCDSEGRFSIGPIPAGEPIELRVGAKLLHPVTLFCKGGDDDILVLLAHAPVQETIRGQLLRGDAPVTRFTVEDTPVVNEEGRFQRIISRAEEDSLQFELGGQQFHRPLPPPGQEMLVRLAAGELAVELGAGGAGVEVRLGTQGEGASTPAGVDGVALFAALLPGSYELSAEGYASRSVEIREGERRRLALARMVSGRIVLRLPPHDAPPDADEFERLPDGRFALDQHPGWHRIILARRSAIEVRVEAGEATEVDLAPPDLARLSVQARPGVLLQLTGQFDGFEVSREEWIDRQGRALFQSLLPGTYRLLSVGGWDRGVTHHTVRVAPSVETQIQVALARGTILGRIDLPPGASTVGTSVTLDLADSTAEWQARTRVDHRGEFRFDEVEPGRYFVRVEADDETYAPASGTVIVTEDATFPPILRLELEPSVRALLRILGPGGEPVIGANASVDGIRQEDLRLGRCLLPRLPATVDVDAMGYAGVRGLAVDREGELRLAPEARLAVRSAEPVVLRIRGGVWEPLPPARSPVADRRGWVRFEGLPAGPAVVTLRDGGPAPAPLHPIQLNAGEETTLDLFPR
ncbi:MAG: carboxypeptidase regulatory-like domain-containing protein [Planctomycetaceae bacterium]